MYAIDDKHQRLAAIEPHDRMLIESRSFVLVNRSPLQAKKKKSSRSKVRTHGSPRAMLELESSA